MTKYTPPYGSMSTALADTMRGPASRTPRVLSFDRSALSRLRKEMSQSGVSGASHGVIAI